MLRSPESGPTQSVDRLKTIRPSASHRNEWSHPQDRKLNIFHQHPVA
jgi:hypothetical protein